MSIFTDTLEEKSYKYEKYKSKYINEKTKQNGSSSSVSEIKKLKIITPATLMNILENENVAIVNTLENQYF